MKLLQTKLDKISFYAEIAQHGTKNVKT